MMANRGRANGHYVNNLPSVFDICTPRKDIRDGMVESELAADLSQVAGGGGLPEYSDPVRFFASTYPTKGIKDLLHHVLSRLGGQSSSAIFWLNTSFGGGKTHALIALLHAAKSSPSNTISEFVDPSLLPGEHVNIAVFDGQNADISSGHKIGDGIRAHTPWGEVAYRLAGSKGYHMVDDNIDGSPPGANTLKEIIGDGPTLILLDELAVYLRKALMYRGAGKQFVAFLTALIKAVEGSSNAALVYTLAAGSDADTGEAYREENLKLQDELESVSSRKSTLLNPTEEGETIQILRRRLFERRDEAQVDVVVDAYRNAWKANRGKLPDVTDLPKTVDDFRVGYPLHPDILSTLISKTSTLENFQRVRGMLRILGYVVHDLWTRRDKLKPNAIHLHHFDIGNEKMRLEITAKLKQEAFASAIDTDIACDDANKTSMAQRLDGIHYPGLPPFTTYITRVIFMNTLAFNQLLKGVDARHLKYSILWPGMELGYVDEALARFKSESLYLDDNPEKPVQFQAEPNLSQAIQRAEQGFDDQDLEAEIDKRLDNMFKNGEFGLLLFCNVHEDVPDDTGKPKLVIPKYDQVTASNPEHPPDVVRDIFQHRGIGEGIRMCRNNLIFLVAFDDGVDAMYTAARRYLAMSKLAAPNSITDFADYQQKIISEKKSSSDTNLDDAILKCYKYIYYPDKGNRLTPIMVDWRRGGQRFLVDKLRDAQKLRTNGDMPDNPESLVDRIAKLKNDGVITTLDFRNEFYKDTALPMLIGNEVFSAGIRSGIESGIFVYKRDVLVCGKGDPPCEISIDDDSVVYTTKKAGRLGIWPRHIDIEKPVEPKPDNDGGTKYTEPDASPGPSPGLSSVRAVGTPTSAIRNLLDELRKYGIHSISKMRMESRDDVFSLLNRIGRIREIKVQLKIEGDCETTAGGRLDIEFTGTLHDSEPVIEFLKPQLRNASVGNMAVTLDIDFGDGMSVDWLETFAESLKFVDNDITVSGIVGGLE